MKTIENPTTEKMNGSSRMTKSTDSPWWIVRPSLAAALAGSFAAAVAVCRFAGLHGAGMSVKAGSFAELMRGMSATPTLVAFALFAGAVMFSRHSGRSLRNLCVLLALASLSGAGINAARDSHGRGPIEVLIDNALANAPAVLAGK